NDAEVFGRIIQQGFGAPLPFQLPASRLVGRPNWQCLLAYVGEEAVGGTANFIYGDLAWGGICATLPHARGQGVQNALIHAQCVAAIKAGCARMTAEVEVPPPGEKNSSMNNTLRLGPGAYQRDNWVLEAH
ncbi:MAG TPA: hypothetical protein VEL47_04360, partial [Myxococcota bacterium]|nr:hypothetical protein [Myxococcota bacterium]